MFKVIMKSMTSAHLWLFYPVLYLSAVPLVVGIMNEPNVVTVVSKEGNDAVLPCSLNTRENIVQTVFDWKKDDKKEVFLYDAGIHYNIGRTGQDQQFKGRVSHFPGQLMFGNASILIQNSTVTDSGNYSCIFPHSKPHPQIFKIELYVGSAQQPHIKILNYTKNGILLKCEVQAAYPQPKVEWQDSDGNVLPAEKPVVSYKGGRYFVTLITTVTKTTTSRFYCIVTQEDINHMIEDDIYLPFFDKSFEDKPCKSACLLTSGWVSGVLTVGAPLAVYLIIKHIKHRKTGYLQGPSEGPNLAQLL
ncbi:butyrophilin-like protein 10 isoform X2 [Channa argus]|uniref:butyrophilin-like protein 10 isoform X2 n=1 Tax=Channa argus TaxID=215402 RepID=UPI00351FE597